MPIGLLCSGCGVAVRTIWPGRGLDDLDPEQLWHRRRLDGAVLDAVEEIESGQGCRGHLIVPSAIK
jgi:hypothetical protein